MPTWWRERLDLYREMRADQVPLRRPTQDLLRQLRWSAATTAALGSLAAARLLGDERTGGSRWGDGTMVVLGVVAALLWALAETGRRRSHPSRDGGS